MGVDVIYPIVNLFQYSLREGLDDSEQIKVERAKTFYSNFYGNLSDSELQKYRDREQSDRAFNADLIEQDKRSIQDRHHTRLDGSRNAIQLGDTYTLHLNFSGELDDRGRSIQRHVNSENAFTHLIKIAKDEDLLPAIDNSFGRTWLLIAFVDNPQADKLEIAKSCCEQIHGKQPDISVKQGNWHGGDLFEFWAPPLSYEQELVGLVKQHPHTIVWLFTIDKIDDIDRIDNDISRQYHHWIRLLHYRHKIFYAYHKSQYTIKNRLKNSSIQEIADQLNASTRSLHHLQNTLLTSLDKFQEHSSCIQFLEDQQHTIEINRDNYRFRYEEMEKEDPNSNLQFLLDFEAKYSNKCQRQISADRAYLDSGLKVLENLSQTIQSTVQIERAKSDRTTNLTIAAFGTGLATSQVVCAIVLTQTASKNEISNVDFYKTSAFEKSLMAGLMPIGLLLIYLVLAKLQSYKSK
jgi:hypothetical protein